jgi:hypothetical protein
LYLYVNPSTILPHLHLRSPSLSRCWFLFSSLNIVLPSHEGGRSTLNPAVDEPFSQHVPALWHLLWLEWQAMDGPPKWGSSLTIWSPQNYDQLLSLLRESTRGFGVRLKSWLYHFLTGFLWPSFSLFPGSDERSGIACWWWHNTK